MTDTNTIAHIPDEAVEAAFEAMNPMKSPSECCLYDVRKGLIAALPYLSAPCAVEVKKLEWQEPTKETNGCWTAKCLIGTYSVVNENGWYAVLDEHAWGVPGFEWSSTDLSKDTRQTAFTAAQADFERRILSCVVTKPVDVAANFTRPVSNIDYRTPQEVFDIMCDRIRALSAEPAQGVPAAARDVLAERRRQLENEGFDARNDDINVRGQIATAAGCYILHDTHLGDELEIIWPWDFSWWKPTNLRRDLVKAGALILAEIERIDRATPTMEAGE